MSDAAGKELGDRYGLMFSIAYRMLSSVSDAEDIVQEAAARYLRARADGVRIDSPKAYLSAVVTRLAIDQLRSARVRRERYVGQWLPEPLLTDGERSDPAAHAEQADSLSMAFLLLLERLNPVERAVFLLHDVFAYEYDEVAAIVDKTATNCRQLAARARRHLADGKPRFDVSSEQRDQLGKRFFAAVGAGDVDALAEMLATDAVLYGDGGGKAPQWTRPVSGAGKVAQVLANVGTALTRRQGRVRSREVNAQPGALLLTADGQLISVFALEVAHGRVRAVRSVINPDKLQHLGPVADVWALLGKRG